MYIGHAHRMCRNGLLTPLTNAAQGCTSVTAGQDAWSDHPCRQSAQRFVQSEPSRLPGRELHQRTTSLLLNTLSPHW